MGCQVAQVHGIWNLDWKTYWSVLLYKQKDRMSTEMVINWLRNNLKSFVIPHSTYKQGHLTVLRNQTNRTRKELYLLANCRE